MADNYFSIFVPRLGASYFPFAGNDPASIRVALDGMRDARIAAREAGYARWNEAVWRQIPGLQGFEEIMPPSMRGG